MDDFNVSSLHESKNEWASRLLTILTPFIIEGLKSIFEESVKLCKENNEMEKYLMTFQNFISRIPKWNSNIIEVERKRIIERSGCSYLEDLIMCVHIIQLKLLTAIRVGQKQKKVDINIPKLDDFIHKVYVQVARKIYKNVYLFELNITSLQIQKHNRELEIIVQECILNAIRESIPVELLLKAYMDETVEEDVTEEIKEEIVPNNDVEPELEPEREVKQEEEKERHEEKEEMESLKSIEVPKLESESIELGRLKFNDIDQVRDNNNNDNTVMAPKNIERLEEISNLRNIQRKLEEEYESDKIKILDEIVKLENIEDITDPELTSIPDLIIDDIEVLE
jgi:hypothetical protein